MLSRIRRTAFCFLVSSVFVTGVASQNTPAANSTAEKRLIAFLTLKPVRDGFCTVNHTCPTAPAQPVAAQPTSPKLKKDDVVRLYTDLQSLKDVKGDYLEALRLYVDGRKAHLPADKLSLREDELRNQLGRLRSGLQHLEDDFKPLRVALDFSSLPTSTSVDNYRMANSAKAVRTSVIATLTTTECEQVYRDAVQNNVLLDKAIQNLSDFIKNTYPDAGKTS